jgi:hypothetical protein
MGTVPAGDGTTKLGRASRLSLVPGCTFPIGQTLLLLPSLVAAEMLVKERRPFSTKRDVASPASRHVHHAFYTLSGLSTASTLVLRLPVSSGRAAVWLSFLKLRAR